MIERDNQIHEQAIRWVILSRDAQFKDWDMLTAWLEASPDNANAYDEIANADADLDAVLVAARRSGAIFPSDDAVGGKPRWHRWATAGLGMAASIALVVFFKYPGPAEQHYVVATAVGQHRVVDLGNAGKVVMNGASRLILDRADTRYAALESGEALFTVSHDPKAPFEVDLGENKVVDLGTVFNIVRDKQDLRIEVVEGALMFNPDSQAVALKAGQSLVRNANRIVVSSVDPSTVASWQSGRLTFRNAPLTRVAADLSRNLGTHITVSPELLSQTFTGSIQLDRNQPRFFSRLGALLSAKVMRVPDGWKIEAGEPLAN